MAKVKKTAALTLDERLEQALVPEGEQPYPIPENWCWTRLGEIIHVSSGKGLTSKNMVSHGTFPVYGGNGINGYHDKANIEPKTIVLGRVGYYCGCVHFICEPAWVTDNALIVDFNKEKICIRFLFWLLCNVDLRKNDSSTAQPVISGSKIYNIEFPLPPFAEQQRIVDRIESLFAKLDEAKEKAQAALDSFETRKAAILHKAFTGKLTAKWREENGTGFELWKEKNLQSVCSMKITDGTHKTPTYCDSGEGTPFISAKDVTSGEICWDHIKYIVPELHKELYARLAPEIDDILLAKNGTTGVAAIVNVEKIFDLYVTIALLRPNKVTIHPHYLFYVINSPICKTQFDDHLTGIGVPNLHLRDIKEVLIPLPTLGEQTEIVRLLDAFFAKEQKAKDLCSVLDNIDLIKKSILARVFRGELGTNDPTEESAVELLKTIC